MSFRSENAYVSGSARRPRGPPNLSNEEVKQPPRPVPDDGSCTTDATPDAALNDARNPCISPGLTEPLLTYAVQRYAYSHWRHAIGPMFEVLGFFGTFGNELMASKYRPMLDAAISGVALIHFGLMENARGAIIASHACYQKALTLTGVAIREIETAASDELLVTVMLLAIHEDHAADLLLSPPTPNSYRHIQGAFSFLPSRLRQSGRSHRSGVLDTLIWRRSIKIAINTGMPFDQALRAYAQYQPSATERMLYPCMIQLADINARMQIVMSKQPGPDQRSALEAVLRVAETLNARMEDLRKLFYTDSQYDVRIRNRQMFPYALQPILKQYYLPIEYSDARALSELNTFRASWFRLNDIIVRVLERNMRVTSSLSLDGQQEKLHSQARELMSTLAADILASVPCYFGGSEKIDQTIDDICKSANQVHVGSLVFPLHSIARAYAASLEQRAVAREVLLLSSRTTGNRTVPMLYNDHGPFGWRALSARLKLAA